MLAKLTEQIRNLAGLSKPKPPTSLCSRCGRVHRGSKENPQDASTNCWATKHVDGSKIASTATAVMPEHLKKGNKNPGPPHHPPEGEREFGAPQARGKQGIPKSLLPTVVLSLLTSSAASAGAREALIDSASALTLFKNDGRQGLIEVDPNDRVQMVNASGGIDLTGALQRTVIMASNTNGELSSMEIQGHLGPPGLPQDIISVGRMLRAGCKFHLELPDNMWLTLPSGECLRLHLTDQDIY